MEAEKQKSTLTDTHRTLSDKFFEAEKKVHELEKLLHKEIVRTKPYFIQKNSLNSTLNDLRSRTMKLYNDRSLAKRAYSDALYNLERISEEIHRMRNRTPGEGAEEEEKQQHEEQAQDQQQQLSLEDEPNQQQVDEW